MRSSTCFFSPLNTTVMPLLRALTGLGIEPVLGSVPVETQGRTRVHGVATAAFGLALVSVLWAYDGFADLGRAVVIGTFAFTTGAGGSTSRTTSVVLSPLPVI